MTKKLGEYIEAPFKTYGPEDAGQKAGWVTAVDNPDRDSFYVLGAYATVGESGASVSTIRHEVTDERLWHDHLAAGFSRACSYAILVIPGEDTRIRNTDTVRFDREKATDLAGHSFHKEFDIDDESVTWGKGDEELVTNLRQVLGDRGSADEFARLYLTINGGVGHGTRVEGFPLSMSYVASNQIYDPSMSDTAAEEQSRFNEYADVLGEQIKQDTAVHEQASRWSLTEEQFVASREGARAAFLRIGELRQTMIAPTLAYTPEGYVRSWPYMDASEGDARVAYGIEQGDVAVGNFGRVSYELEREIKELKKRQEYAARGAQVMFALTVDGRQQSI